MSKHDDLRKAHSLLNDIQGWNIEYHKDASTETHIKNTRRNKKKCKYYNKEDGMCNHAHALCSGVYCGSYVE